MTIKALVESARKWDRNAAVEDISLATIGARSCALCVLYIRDECHGCAVKQHTNLGNCHGTPWSEVKDIHGYWRAAPWDKSLLEPFREAAKKESDFLWSLVPLDMQYLRTEEHIPLGAFLAVDAPSQAVE